MSNSASTPPNRPRRSGREVDELVRAHLPIVGYQVSETMARLPGHVLRDDLVSAGMAALAQAAMSYAAETGVPFSRYATLRIRGALLDELRSMDWAPRGARSRTRQVAAAEETLAAQLGRKPERAELAAALGCSPEELDAARATTERALVSMDAYDGVVAEVLPHEGPGPEEHLLQNEQVKYLHAAVASLPERLRTVVSGLFLEDRSVTDVAAELGVTESRISQLRTEALLLMRDGMNSALEPALVARAERPGGVVDRRRQAYFAAVAAHAAAMPMATLPETSEAAVRGPVPAAIPAPASPVEPGSWAALA
ncbi:sigma-70 family RNA polymerase sigma factor [Quadrisphaera setariae]|uniref:Sigma-70 family RNA polymerase sigma factor n=1 Tax=Quadrisphaera setariae TaxID=2593304 RepID=A0A5C8ZD38_9ACTN|nr:sigma-70 family RNA polymerase sigma factor [Quadrisphaera setariae]TXR55058.1 sigma-70 family RNA polymerase sigma factor [Quadrisphaera setariae]